MRRSSAEPTIASIERNSDIVRATQEHPPALPLTQRQSPVGCRVRRGSRSRPGLSPALTTCTSKSMPSFASVAIATLGVNHPRSQKVR